MLCLLTGGFGVLLLRFCCGLGLGTCFATGLLSSALGSLGLGRCFTVGLGFGSFTSVLGWIEIILPSIEAVSLGVFFSIIGSVSLTILFSFTLGTSITSSSFIKRAVLETRFLLGFSLVASWVAVEVFTSRTLLGASACTSIILYTKSNFFNWLVLVKPIFLAISWSSASFFVFRSEISNI